MKTEAAVCDVCHRREAFFLRGYSGVRLCRRCFTKSIEDKVRVAIADYDMFKFNDKIAVAVSGGKDSVSLLHVLAKIEKRFPMASLKAVTVDEGIKGYRDEALRIAAESCRRLGIEHSVVSFRDLFGCTFDEMVNRLRKKKDMKETPCAICGVLRRKALNVAARKIGATKLAMGHTLDDEVQTILLNVFHGDVLRIAKEKPVTDAVHPKLVPRIKPLCEVPEREMSLYAYVMEIGFQSTPCPYASEALRNDVRQMLDRIDEKHPGVKFTVFNSIRRIRPAIEEMARREGLRECSECGEPSADVICRTCQMCSQLDSGHRYSNKRSDVKGAA